MWDELVELRAFGPGQPARISDLVALHRELLPTSPALHLGDGFLEDFYYDALPADGLILGQVAYLGDRPVGFVVVTPDSNGFLSTAVRRRWGLLVKVLLRHPPGPRRTREAVRLARSRDGEREPGLGEVLSLGVRPPEAGGPTSSKVRRVLARQLVGCGLEMLGDRPAIALVDDTNVSARALYTSLGWTVSAKVTAGWPTPQIVYRSPPAEAWATGHPDRSRT